MKIPQLANRFLMGFLFAVCLTFSACKKAPSSSSETSKESPLDWNLKTTLVAYKSIGNSDGKWDESAKRALTEFARNRANMTDKYEPVAEIISTNVAVAIQAGCDDPMVNYLFIKYAMNQTNSPQAFADAFRKTADDMQQSSYPNIRKFYAALRAAEQIRFVAGDNPHTPAEVHHYRRLAITNLAATLDDKSIPIGEVDDACHQIFEALNQNPKQYEDCYGLIEDALLKDRSNQSVVWLLKGESYIKKGWFARGGGYINTVTVEGAKTFDADLAIADESLNQAWKLNPKDPRIAVKMMWVELGQGKGRKRMELWFKHAMELDPNNYDACNTKCLYLEPKWYGSIDDMLSFGRECVQNTNWGGRVPLVLVDAHWDIPLYYLAGSEKTNYWTRPEVWPDIKAAYDRFFELNPDAIGYYHNYALYAYRCEQWEVLNELIPKLGPVNYAFFGGKDKFDKMVQLAKEYASKPQ